MNGASLNRRTFLVAGAAVGGGLLIGAGWARRRGRGEPRPDAYVGIEPDGTVTVQIKNPEIGQGIRTAFAMIVAEELGARWDDVRVEQSPIDEATYGPQFAGGSRSIADTWDRLRLAGAAAREMLAAAAAERWQVAVGSVSVDESRVTHSASNRTLGIGELAGAAAMLPVPLQPALKNRADYRIVGTPRASVDNRSIVTGEAEFGIDKQRRGSPLRLL